MIATTTILRRNFRFIAKAAAAVGLTGACFHTGEKHHEEHIRCSLALRKSTSEFERGAGKFIGPATKKLKARLLSIRIRILRQTFGI